MSESPPTAPDKLLILLPWGERLGGAENHLWTFLRHLDRDRFEPVVVLLGAGSLEQELAGLSVPTHVLPTTRMRRGGRLLRTVRCLAEIVRTEQPALLFNWGGKSQIYGSPAATLARFRGPRVWWQLGVPNRHPLHAAATFLPAHAIACASEAVAAAQGRRRPRRPTFVVHPGVDLPDAARSDAPSREALGIPDGRLVMGLVGRLDPFKGQDRFLAALAMLRKRGQDIHGLLVGGDAYEAHPGFATDLRELAAGAALDGAVTFTGQVRNPFPYLEMMDVFVSASIGEPFGIVMVEAMAAGLPVVAVDAAGPREIVEREATGLLVPTGSPLELANAVERIVTDADLRTRMARGAVDRFKSRFTAERMTRQLEHELTRLLASRAAGPRTTTGSHPP